MYNNNMRTILVDINGRETEIPVIVDEAYNEEPNFSLDGEAELTSFCADGLMPYVTGADVILTTKKHGILLGYELAKRLGHDRFAVAKKSEKIYILEGLSISLRGKDGSVQNLFLSTADTERLRGKKVAIVDAFTATGDTLLGLEKLVEKAGGTVHSRNFVLLKEPYGADKDSINYLGVIPEIG